MIVNCGFKVICDKYRKVIIGEKPTNKVKSSAKKGLEEKWHKKATNYVKKYKEPSVLLKKN